MFWFCFSNLRQKLDSWMRRGLGIFHRGSTKKGDTLEVIVDPPEDTVVAFKGSSRQGSVRVGPLPSPASSRGLPADQDGDSRLSTDVQSYRLNVQSVASSLQQPDSDISTLNQNSPATSEAGEQDNDIVPNFDRLSHNDTSHESTLREQLCEVRKEAPKLSHRYFVPANDLERLVTVDAISKELQEWGVSEEEANSSSEDILNSALRLFAILVYVRRGKLILDFRKEDIDDTHLPFSRSDKSSKARAYKLCSRRHPGEPIKCMERWDRDLVDEFGRDQWCMLAPVFEFHDGIKHYDLDDNCILPWAEDEERNGSTIDGGHGSVCRIAIHPAHQRIVGHVNQMSLSEFVAIKRLYSTNEANFKTEVAMLKKLKKRKHAHLVNLLATFRYKKHFYLIFPYAHCNLRQYWQHTPIPDFTAATISWVLLQCRFVASALLMVHESKSTQEFAFEYHPVKSSSSWAGASNSEEGETRRYGRHGDIKAENILWFDGDDDSPGHLVVADFGLMAFHTKDTRSNESAKYVTGSPSYEAPELLLNSKISRAFDVWGLGCLYLEFITWLVCGWEHLHRFPEARDGRGPPAPQFHDDTFFTIIEDGKRAVVREAVKTWIADLHEMPRASSFVHDFLDIISDHLLVVNPKKRINVGQLNTDLSNMLKRAAEDHLYLTDPKPFTPRTQQPHPMSLAAYHRNGYITSPDTQEGVPLPKCLSGILDSEASHTSTLSNRRHMLENISPISSPRLG